MGWQAWLRRRWRAEATILLTWCLATYAFFSYLDAKEARYILFLGPPIVCLAVVGVYSLSAALAGLVSRIPRRDLAVPLASGALGSILLVQVVMAARQPVPSIDGFREVVAYVEELVPEGAVFYDGPHHGIFVAYLQADDPEYRRRVVLGSKLLYAYAVHTGWRLEEFVKSPEESVALLRRRGGARVLVIEHGDDSEEVAAQRHLREAVRGAPFELLRSFPMRRIRVDRVDVYRMNGPIDESETVDLPVPDSRVGRPLRRQAHRALRQPPAAARLSFGRADRRSGCRATRSPSRERRRSRGRRRSRPPHRAR